MRKRSLGADSVRVPGPLQLVAKLQNPTIYSVFAAEAVDRILARIAKCELKAPTYNDQVIYRAAWLTVWFAFHGSDPDPFGAAVCKMEFHNVRGEFPNVKPRPVLMPKSGRLLITPMPSPERWQRPLRPRQCVVMRVLLDTVLSTLCWRDRLACGHSVDWIQFDRNQPMPRRRECQACYERQQQEALRSAGADRQAESARKSA